MESETLVHRPRISRETGPGCLDCRSCPRDVGAEGPERAETGLITPAEPSAFGLHGKDTKRVASTSMVWYLGAASVDGPRLRSQHPGALSRRQPVNSTHIPAGLIWCQALSIFEQIPLHRPGCARPRAQYARPAPAAFRGSLAADRVPFGERIATGRGEQSDLYQTQT